MCGRYTVHSPAETLRVRFRIALPEGDLDPRYNVCPSQQVLTVAVGRDGERRAVPMRWGFIPFWSETPETKLSTINAKAESAASSRLYRDALQRRRCLILADGFYEWQPAKTKKEPKVPHWIARRDRAPFAFAGIYSVWRPKDQPDAQPLLSCAILTVGANPVVAPIHARMPLILLPEHEDAWIDPALREPEQVAALLKPDAESLVAQPVSRLVNSPQHDGPALICEASEATAAAAAGPLEELALRPSGPPAG
jgi:putative SOS response-associated peptidase YedK